MGLPPSEVNTSRPPPSPRRGWLGLMVGLYSYLIILGLWARARTGDGATLLGAAMILLVVSALVSGYALVWKFLVLAGSARDPSDLR